MSERCATRTSKRCRENGPHLAKTITVAYWPWERLRPAFGLPFSPVIAVMPAEYAEQVEKKLCPFLIFEPPENTAVRITYNEENYVS